MAYAIVRTDRLMGTGVRSYVRSVKYMGDGSAATAIENGNIVKLDGLMAKGTNEVEREIYKAVTPAAGDTLETIALIASPEIMYDERKKDLAEFRNEAGDVARAYKLHSGDIFSVTAEALDGTAAVGDIVELQASTKLKVVSSNTAGSTVIGKIIEKAKGGMYEFYAIEVA